MLRPGRSTEPGPLHSPYPKTYLPRRFSTALKRAYQTISGPTGWPGALGVRGHWLEITILRFGLPPALGRHFLAIHPRGSRADRGEEGLSLPRHSGLTPCNGAGLLRYPLPPAPGKGTYPWHCSHQPFLTLATGRELRVNPRGTAKAEETGKFPKLPRVKARVLLAVFAGRWQTRPQSGPHKTRSASQLNLSALAVQAIPYWGSILRDILLYLTQMEQPQRWGGPFSKPQLPWSSLWQESKCKKGTFLVQRT